MRLGLNVFTLAGNADVVQVPDEQLRAPISTAASSTQITTQKHFKLKNVFLTA
jgi:hypothetical protein